MMAEVITQRSFAGLRIQTAADREKHLNCLFYAESGTGKTVLAGSADLVPGMRPVLVIDVEGGTESLRNFYPDVDVVRVTTWAEMNHIYEMLRKGEHEYQTVVLDSLTEIQKFNMYSIMTQLVQARPDLDPDVPGMREWGKNLEQIRKFVRLFRDLPMHVIFTALVRVEKDQKTGATSYLPSLSGKMAAEVAAFLDIVAYYYVKEITNDDGKEESVRLLLTKKTSAYTAKDRSGKLPTVVQDPTMKDLYEMMYRTTTDK